MEELTKMIETVKNTRKLIWEYLTIKYREMANRLDAIGKLFSIIGGEHNFPLLPVNEYPKLKRIFDTKNFMIKSFRLRQIYIGSYQINIAVDDKKEFLYTLYDGGSLEMMLLWKDAITDVQRIIEIYEEKGIELARDVTGKILNDNEIITEVTKKKLMESEQK